MTDIAARQFNGAHASTVVDPCSARPVNDNQVTETEQQCSVDGVRSGVAVTPSVARGYRSSVQPFPDRMLVGRLNKIYSVIVIVSSANKYRKYKSSMLIRVLLMDSNYTDIYDGKKKKKKKRRFATSRIPDIAPCG